MAELLVVSQVVHITARSLHQIRIHITFIFVIGTRRDGNWRCPEHSCGYVNFAGRFECRKCGARRTDLTGGPGPQGGSGDGLRGYRDLSLSDHRWVGYRNLLFPRLDSAHPLRLRLARNRKRGPTKTKKKKQTQ